MQATNRPFHALALALIFGTVSLSTTAARAETTAWADNEGGRMRVVALPPEADGTVRALLQIEPKPGWITYWREPGESGIPPQVSVTGGAVLEALAYPVPKVLALGSFRDIGYDAAVSLPVRLAKATGPATLDAFIGICNRICIPFQARFALTLSPGVPDSTETAALDAAGARLPEAAAADFVIRHARIKGETLLLTVTLPAGAAEAQAIVTGPEGHVFSATANAANGTDTGIEVPLAGLPAQSAPSDIPWQALITAGGRSIEMPVTPQ